MIKGPSGRDGRPLMKVQEVVARLNVARSTYYTIRFFRDRTIYITPGCPRVDPADVDLYLSLHQGRAA